MTTEKDLDMERRMTTVETVLKSHVESCDKRAGRSERYLQIILGALILYAVKVIFHIPV
jgi:hypothetical protein